MPREEDNRVGDKLINEVGSQRQLFAYPCIRQSQTPRLKSCPLRYGKRGGGGEGGGSIGLSRLCFNLPY